MSAINAIEYVIRKDTESTEIKIEGSFRMKRNARGKFRCLILKDKGLLILSYSRAKPQKATADA